MLFPEESPEIEALIEVLTMEHSRIDSLFDLLEECE